MMKQSHIAKGALIALAMAAASAAQAAPDTASGTGKANVLQQITVSQSAELSFGTIIADAASTGYVTVEPEGIRSECSVATCSGSFTPGSFNVTGTPGSVLTISHAGVSSNPVTFSLTNGTDTITFGLILHTPTITLSGTGTGSFDIGGRVLVPANQADGNYTGTYEVTADYQ